MGKKKTIFSGLADLCRRGVSFHLREFNSSNAAEFAYDYSFLVPTGPVGLTGIAPANNYFYALPPEDFNYHVQPPHIPDAAPEGSPNPLITPALATSFYANAIGPDGKSRAFM